MQVTFENTIILFVCPAKFHINIVSIYFLLGLKMVARETKTMLMQNIGGQTRSIMVFMKVAYWQLLLGQWCCLKISTKFKGT